MQRSWLALLDHVLRPARPELQRCLKERARHLELHDARRVERARAIAGCIERIDDARRAVFEADDGVVGAQMTALEREWRRLSREDPEAGLMDLWARLVGPASLDRKRWRDSAPSDWLEALVALAADDAGVNAAEAEVVRLSDRLGRHGFAVGRRARFRLGAGADRGLLEVLDVVLRLVVERAAERERVVIAEHAERERQRIRAAALERFPARPHLAEELACAAAADLVCRAARLDDAENPLVPLHSLWALGYPVAAFDATSVTLEVPALDER